MEVDYFCICICNSVQLWWVVFFSIHSLLVYQNLTHVAFLSVMKITVVPEPPLLSYRGSDVWHHWQVLCDVDSQQPKTFLCSTSPRLMPCVYASYFLNSTIRLILLLLSSIWFSMDHSSRWFISLQNNHCLRSSRQWLCHPQTYEADRVLKTAWGLLVRPISRTQAQCEVFQSVSWVRLYWMPSWNQQTALSLSVLLFQGVWDWVEGIWRSVDLLVQNEF